MGTGKSTAAKEAAAILGLPSIDLDRAIERRAGRSIRRIFAEDGEPAFRAMERDAMLEAARLSAVVVATGGGAVMQEASFGELARGAEVVVLTADPDVIARRVGGGDTRPLIAGDDAGGRMRSLMAERAPRYAAFGEPLDTSHAIRHVAGRAAADRYRARTAAGPADVRITVSGPAGPYAVLIGRGALLRVAEELCAVLPSLTSVAVVGAAAVSGSVADRVRAGLARAGIRATAITIPGDEAHKTVETAAGLWDRFRAAGLSRSDAVVAVGGGATLDAVGFAAATYARGVPLVNVPTTLLAMVDASLGGKVGVDHAGAKNLVGSFHHPSLVITDPDALAGLPTALVRHGLAEAVKEAVLASPAMLDVLETASFDAAGIPEDLDWLVEQAVRIKAAYVGADPADRSVRQSLNLGHTFAHAIESASGYTMPHGEAVSIGTVAAARLGERLGVTRPGTAVRLAALFVRLGLPVHAPPALRRAAMLDAMAADKKRRAGGAVFVVPTPGGAALVEGLDPRVALGSLVEGEPS
jgi:3-dehydroquinate synthase